MTRQTTFFIIAICSAVIALAILFSSDNTKTDTLPTIEVPIATPTISGTGADLKPLPVEESTIINETAQLRLKLPVTTERFSLRYDLDENNFKISVLQEGVTNEEVLNWVKAQGLHNIPPEKFIIQ